MHVWVPINISSFKWIRGKWHVLVIWLANNEYIQMLRRWIAGLFWIIAKQNVYTNIWNTRRKNKTKSSDIDKPVYSLLVLLNRTPSYRNTRQREPYTDTDSIRISSIISLCVDSGDDSTVGVNWSAKLFLFIFNNNNKNNLLEFNMTKKLGTNSLNWV